MKKRFIGLIILGLFLMTIFAGSVSAAGIGDMLGEEGMIGGIVTGVFSLAQTLVTTEFDMEYLGSFLDNTFLETEDYTTTWFALIMSFMVLWGLLTAAAPKLPVFKDNSSAGARKMFVIALSLFVTFVSGLPIYLQFLLVQLGAMVQLGIVALLIVAFWWIWKSTQKGLASVNSMGAEAGRINANARKMNVDNKKMNAESKASEGLIKREESAMAEVKRLVGGTEEEDMKISDGWKQVKGILSNIPGMKSEDAMKEVQVITEMVTKKMDRETRGTLSHQKLIEEAIHKASQMNHELIKDLTLDDEYAADLGGRLRGHTGSISNDEMLDGERKLREAKHQANEFEKILKQVYDFEASEMKSEQNIINEEKQFFDALERSDFNRASLIVDDIIHKLAKIGNEDVFIVNQITKAEKMLGAEFEEVSKAMKEFPR